MPVGVGAAIGAVGAIGKGIFGANQISEANKINPIYDYYQTSPYAKMQLGMAQQLYNGRMFGAADLEKNIMANNANFNYNVGRNATSGSQAIALSALGEEQTNKELNNLAITEKQNQYSLLNNLNAAYNVMNNESYKVYQDRLNKYMIDTNQKNQLKNAGYQNLFGAIGDIGGGLIQAGSYYDKNR